MSYCDDLQTYANIPGYCVIRAKLFCYTGAEKCGKSACAVKKDQILTASYIYCSKLNAFLLHVPFQTSVSAA